MTSIEREQRLSEIKLSQVCENQEWLREVFEIEFNERLKGEMYDQFESIYHCSTLLYSLKNLDDVELFHKAKFCRDMDLSISFDWQFIFVDNPQKIIDHFENKNAEIVDTVKIYTEEYHKENIAKWFERKCKYYRIEP